MHYLTAWATLAILALYSWTMLVAGRARGVHKVPAPSMDGPPAFLAAQRVQANTLEQLPLALVPMWLCALYLSDQWAAAGGLLWCAGRFLYAVGYYNAPARREAGFVVGAVASALLLGGSVAGLVLR